MSSVKLQRGSVFERYETKYLLDRHQYETMLAQLETRMQVDQYGRHTICTLYYDTDDFAVIRRCLDKPKFREKLRLRSYGVPTHNSTVYLELKKKLAGITYKRRFAMPLSQADAYMQNGRPPLFQDQIFHEIDWYVNQRDLSEKVLLCYDRIALFGREDPGLRITFDRNVRWRDYALALDKGDHGALLLPRGRYLMEMKSKCALPTWLAALLSQNAIYPTSFSKYGTIYSRFLSTKEAMRHVV